MTPRMWLPPVVLAILVSVLGFAQDIPVGTVLPVMMGTSLDSGRSKPGDKVTARLMQDVVLGSGERIRAGARLYGKVEEAAPASSNASARVVVRFDRLVAGQEQYSISVSLRALASMADVFSAQLPTNNFDEYGTSTSDWTTVQVGGAAVYLGDGTVRDALDIVGRAPAYGVVTGKLMPALKRGCPAEAAAGSQEQSLWLFSPWACGTYGFEDLTIVRSGASQPLGTIELSAPTALKVRSGSGWLLQVQATSAPPSKSAEPRLPQIVRRITTASELSPPTQSSS